MADGCPHELHGLVIGSRRGNLARRARLVDEAAAGLVVAAVVPEEALVRARELLGAVDAERLDLLVGGAAAALLYELLYLRPPRPLPVGPPETGLEEPRPGDTAVS